jgi:aspartate-semialdehyde dehydrogenase
MDESTALIVPEINGALVNALEPGHGGGIIANPNCSTIQVAMAVAPLDRAFGVREAHVTTLQAVSGGGQAAVATLMREEGGEIREQSVFPRPIHRNAIPAIGQPLDDGSFEEEAKVVRELRKILGRGEDLAVSCTATRVPVVNGHSAAIRLVCRREFDPAAARDALARFPGVQVEAEPHGYATPLEIDGSREVHVGRLRADPCDPRSLLCWVVADNLLKGAAWNAVQIAGLLAGEKVG